MAVAKNIVAESCGFGKYKVYGAAAPSANWEGLHCADGRIFLNLASEKSLEDNVVVLAHELAHEQRDLHDYQIVQAMQGNFVKILTFLKENPKALSL